MTTPESQPQAPSDELGETVVHDPSHSEREATQATPAGKESADPQAATTVTPPANPRPKTYRLGDFELRREIGRGGMGKVFLAQQISLDRPCAVKVMSSELSRNPTFVERFIREARAMAKLDHPNVVRCFAVGEEQGKHYVAMELIDGQSMQDWLDDLGRLEVPDALLATLVCADALQFAHAKNMIHRDVKPDNLLVTRQGVVKVADLGLAKATDEDMSMTQSGTGLGTPHYMPPEQARNAKHVDARCDVYALGVTLYHFVTGQLPFRGETVLDLITAKEQGQFKPARRINSAVPERLDLIIDKMMARDPKHRYGSCAEVVKDLEDLNLAGESLSFVTCAEGAVVVRRNASPPTAPLKSRNATTASDRPTSKRRPKRSGSVQRRRGSSRPSAETSADWYVRYSGKGGKLKVSRMSTQQILQAMRSGKLDVKTRLARDPQDAFLPLAQFPVFEDEANRMVTRFQQQRRTDHLADAYEKIERQYNRQKWWRLLSNFRDGTLGVIGLILWLALIGAVGALVIWGMMQGWEFLGTWVESLG